MGHGCQEGQHQIGAVEEPQGRSLVFGGIYDRAARTLGAQAALPLWRGTWRGTVEGDVVEIMHFSKYVASWRELNLLVGGGEGFRDVGSEATY